MVVIIRIPSPTNEMELIYVECILRHMVGFVIDDESPMDISRYTEALIGRLDHYSIGMYAVDKSYIKRLVRNVVHTSLKSTNQKRFRLHGLRASGGTMMFRVRKA